MMMMGCENKDIQPQKQTHLHTSRHADQHAHTCMACTHTHTHCCVDTKIPNKNRTNTLHGTHHANITQSITHSKASTKRRHTKASTCNHDSRCSHCAVMHSTPPNAQQQSSTGNHVPPYKTKATSQNACMQKRSKPPCQTAC